MTDAPPSTPGRSSLWYFIGLTLLAVVLVGWLYLFVQEHLAPTRQLKMEQLVAARQRWDASKITDYQMIYTVQRGGGTSSDEFFVVVKDGKVQDVVLNHAQHLPPDQFNNHSMRGLFNDIERFLQMDERPDASRTFRQGIFDSSDGHLVYYRRQVLDGPERVEIDVKEFKPGSKTQ
jgi:hypothetical protein